jgi:glycerophosphoryl diester phosphodiesterase
MKNKRQKLILLCALLAAAIALVFLYLQSRRIRLPVSTQYIVHAGGIVDGQIGTNSLEALENAYNQGNRVVELDFNFTSDGQLACTHDWYSYDGTPTLEGFYEQWVYPPLTPMTITEVAAFMHEHPDLHIVTDVKDQNISAAQYIQEHHSDLTDRFIIQIYNEEEYQPIRELGFKNIIFTLYCTPYEYKTDTDHLVRFAWKNPLLGYTFAYELCDIEGYVKNMRYAGVPLFIHTVNDFADQQAYFDMGISGIYTDNTIHK